MNLPCLARLLVAAAPTFSVQAGAQSNPVNCSTAKQDIDQLEHEKKSTDERKVKGVLSIMPIGIAINAVSSTSSSNKKMHVDDYNKQLNRRIAEIKSVCKM